jgi:hypothetical protein
LKTQTTYLIHKLKNCTFTLQENSELISSCSNIALCFLSKKFQYDFLIFFHQGFTFQDLATDAITPLFIKNKSGELPIRKALLNWDKEITDEVYTISLSLHIRSLTFNLQA